MSDLCMPATVGHEITRLRGEADALYSTARQHRDSIIGEEGYVDARMVVKELELAYVHLDRAHLLAGGK